MLAPTKHTVLWGHNLQDYREMFALSAEDLSKSILEYGGGSASFNVEMLQQEKKVVSCDELYSLSAEQLKKQISEESEEILAVLSEDPKSFLWEEVGSLEALNKQRQQASAQFFADFSIGKQAGRYLGERLPNLPFKDYEFDLALCSHFLFGNRGGESEAFHIAAISELCRVAHEVRIFPLLDSEGEISALVGPVMLQLQQMNFGVEVRSVPYQLQKNGNAMLCIWAQECTV